MKALNRFSKRERYAVYAAAAFICLYVVIEFMVTPFLERRDRAERMLQTKRETIQQMRAMKSEYESLTEQNRSFKKYFADRPAGFTLFSFLDQLAGEADVKDNIAYMKPSKSRPKNSPFNVSLVELKLQGINMKQLAPYLHKVETSKYMVFIRRISITKTGKEGLIDAVVQVETFEA
ncbi:MAG: type II secretion system protein GspM [Thermodesulfobacteriota bacterium]